jgi:hypothetical protein
MSTAGIAVLRVPDLPGRSDLEVAAGVLIGAIAQVDIAGQLPAPRESPSTTIPA